MAVFKVSVFLVSFNSDVTISPRYHSRVCIQDSGYVSESYTCRVDTRFYDAYSTTMFPNNSPPRRAPCGKRAFALRVNWEKLLSDSHHSRIQISFLHR